MLRVIADGTARLVYAGYASIVCALLLGAALPSCADDTRGAGGSGAAGDGGGGSGGATPPPVIDPQLFDCSRSQDPPRSSPVPIACATDPTCTERLVSGHRGAGGLAPEDTVSGVHAAIALGHDFVETDPRPTKDGFLVNLHDTSVDRTTNGVGEALDLTLAEIQAFELETLGLPGDFSCERVPTLQEILLAARGRVHVLVDANKTDRVDLLVAAIQETDALEWAIFDTSSVDKIDEAILLEPNLLTMIRVDTEADLTSELDHFAAHPPVIVETTGAPLALFDTVHARGNRALSDVFVTDIAAGLADDPSLYGELFDVGLDIAQSDRPDLVLRYLGRFPE